MEEKVIPYIKFIREVFDKASVPIDFNSEPLYQHGEGNRVREFALKHPDLWDKKLFVTMANSFGLKPFRKEDDHPKVNRVHAPERYYNEVFWPVFKVSVDSLNHLMADMYDAILPEGGPWDKEDIKTT